MRIEEHIPAGARATANWLNDTCLSAAVLGFAVILARAAAPDKFHLLQCIAALLPLSAGYKQTERRAARGTNPAAPPPGAVLSMLAGYVSLTTLECDRRQDSVMRCQWTASCDASGDGGCKVCLDRMADYLFSSSRSWLLVSA